LLPSAQWEKGLFHGIREPLIEYLQAEHIQPHSQKHNLLSSWALCANMYFPFRGQREGHELLSGFLSSQLELVGWHLTALELEFEAASPLDPSTLLGEGRGRRGANQTSPDLALVCSGPSGSRSLVLVECKYVEKDFGICSGYSQSTKKLKGRSLNPDRDRCNDADRIIENPESTCHLLSWGRRYWEHLEEVADDEAFGSLEYCPARSKGYQLLREYAYAQALSNSEEYDNVVYAIAWDARNTALTGSMQGAGLRDIETDWSRLFPHGVPIKTWSHDDWVAHVERIGSSPWNDWVEYVRNRYDIRSQVATPD
jgi:hypothetical protein